jgi:hypothetical protein
LRKRLAVLLTVALMAVMALLVVAPAFAFAPDGSPGGQGEGQSQATDNCFANIQKQGENGVSAAGGPREDVQGPANCDHLTGGKPT